MAPNKPNMPDSKKKGIQAKPAPKGAPIPSKLDGLKKLLTGGRGKTAAPAPAAKGAPAAAKAAIAVKGKGKLPTKAEPAPKAVAGKKGAPAPAAKAAAVATVKQVVGKKGKSGGVSNSLRASAIDHESVCREVACENLATTGGYCRLHYIKNWKKIKRKDLILREKKLNQYIEELVAKYPDKYIEAIRQDLANEKEFAKVITDLDLDEGVDDFDSDAEAVESLIDNIKRDYDDEGETF